MALHLRRRLGSRAGGDADVQCSSSFGDVGRILGGKMDIGEKLESVPEVEFGLYGRRKVVILFGSGGGGHKASADAVRSVCMSLSDCFEF